MGHDCVVLSYREIVGCVNLVLHDCAGSVYFGSFRALLLLLLLLLFLNSYCKC